MQSLLPFVFLKDLEDFYGHKFTEKGLKTSAYVIIFAVEINRSAFENYEYKIIFSKKPAFVCCLPSD
jgi:site-specific DNA-cytosine methylase